VPARHELFKLLGACGRGATNGRERPRAVHGGCRCDIVASNLFQRVGERPRCLLLLMNRPMTTRCRAAA
jgi:hypothetical protein